MNEPRLITGLVEGFAEYELARMVGGGKPPA